jgi:formylglycine-generating enzyme
LDKYLVTVGRFRQFVSAWSGGAGYRPPAGSGRHSHLNGGKGLADSASPGSYETGWVASNDGNIALTSANLGCAGIPGDTATWTDAAGSQEDLPIKCTNWYESYAFCIWDGGFLPSEAEWEYAAAGGSQQREYPWGSTDPGTANEFAIYGCFYPSGSGSCALGVGNIAPVGTAAQGGGMWGQLDLAGELYEWTLDSFAAYVDPCVDCAYLSTASDRVVRGGEFHTPSEEELSYDREEPSPPETIRGDVGFRCARSQ